MVRGGLEGIHRKGQCSTNERENEMLNHYPIFGRKIPSSCKVLSGSADPFQEVTCPCCRARIRKQVLAKREGANTFSKGSAEHRAFHKNADALEKVLSQ